MERHDGSHGHKEAGGQEYGGGVFEGSRQPVTRDSQALRATATPLPRNFFSKSSRRLYDPKNETQPWFALTGAHERCPSPHRIDNGQHTLGHARSKGAATLSTAQGIAQGSIPGAEESTQEYLNRAVGCKSPVVGHEYPSIRLMLPLAQPDGIFDLRAVDHEHSPQGAGRPRGYSRGSLGAGDDARGWSSHG